ncbi:MAG: tetratricopeptide repeat protein, partial [Brevundimonas sp.]|nr:tetratricopeptide repeat protein [Brevundimonas sp.]
WLVNASWIPLEELLSKRPGEITRSAHRDTYYPVAWLLTHWFMSDDARRGQLQTYIAAVGAGVDPVVAMQDATGMTLGELRRQLSNYTRGALRVAVYNVERADPEVVITTLPPSADDLLLLGQRLKVGVPDGERAATAALVRQRAARHPNDPFALLQLGHAELHFGDPAEGEAVLTRLLEIEPENVEALQLMASRYTALAHDEADDRTRHLVQAQGYLRRAYAADPEQYYTLYMLAQVRETAAGYPTENDLLTWRLAHERAPQLPGIRLGFASAMMQADRFDAAIALLQPLADSPHGGPATDAAQTLMDRAKNRQPPLSREEIDAAQDASAPPPEPAEPEPSQPEPSAELRRAG